MSSILHVWNHLILKMIPWGSYHCYPHLHQAKSKKKKKEQGMKMLGNLPNIVFNCYVMLPSCLLHTILLLLFLFMMLPLKRFFLLKSYSFCKVDLKSHLYLSSHKCTFSTTLNETRAFYLTLLSYLLNSTLHYGSICTHLPYEVTNFLTVS